MIGDYLPSVLEHEDYPDLIPEGQTVDTLASGIAIVAYNWPKNSDHYRRIDKFVNALFPRLAEFQKPPCHEKWKDTILAANVPGWKRFDSAEEWLKNDREPTGRKVISEANRNQMFEDLMKWMKRSTAR